MNETVHLLARHGYLLLVGAVLARQACLPIPADLILVAAGALAHSGRLSLAGLLGLSVLTFLVADFGWYEAGRKWGDRTLHFLCGLSPDPGSWVHKANAIFARHGVRTLLISKFIVGLDAVAAPLTGAAHIAPLTFVIFDAVGALLWSSAHAALGYIFSDQLDRLAVHFARMGASVAIAVAAAVVFFIVKRLANWYRFMRQFKLARITPEELNQKLNAGEDILIIDLQGHMGNPAKPMAIPGAVRIDPHRLEQYRDVEIPSSQEIVLYCDAPGEFTSARVALALRQKGVEHVRPLEGGLQGWRNRGFPVTSEVSIPPIPAIRPELGLKASPTAAGPRLSAK